MSELEALRKVAGTADRLVQEWSDAGEETRLGLVKDIGQALKGLEAAEVAAGTWEETHA
jgi:hypothetical protein